MYVPPHFQEDRPEILARIIGDHPLATLVTGSGETLTADHLPLVLASEAVAGGKLLGHVAKANPLSHTCADGAAALAIFRGAHAYVTPSWYPSKQAGGRVVPTWNYEVVHVHGRIAFIRDPAWLLALVTRLTAQMESARPTPWQVRDAPADFIDTMLAGIVGIELTLIRVEGKRKLSQNRSAADRAGVIAGLEAEPNDTAHAMAACMRRSD